MKKNQGVNNSKINFTSSVNCLNSLSTKCSNSMSNSNNNLNSLNINGLSSSLNSSNPNIVIEPFNDNEVNNSNITLAKNSSVIPSNQSLNLNLKNLDSLGHKANVSQISKNNNNSNPPPQNATTEKHQTQRVNNNHYNNQYFSSAKDYFNYSGEYINDIYVSLLSEEKNTKIKPEFGYMLKQNDINEKIRAILVDWFFEIQGRFRLQNQTIYRTVFILDTYLSLRYIPCKYFQLLGFGCLLIACKSQEIFFPKSTEILSTTDNNYTKEQLLLMEMEILNTLEYGIFFPNAEEFYNIIAKVFKFNKKQYYFGKYFMESSLIDYNMIKYPPSVIAVSCCYIVMKYFGMENYKSLYSNNFILKSFPQKIIKEAARELCFLVRNLSVSEELKAVREKYTTDEFLNVAKCPQ